MPFSFAFATVTSTDAVSGSSVNFLDGRMVAPVLRRSHSYRCRRHWKTVSWEGVLAVLSLLSNSFAWAFLLPGSACPECCRARSRSAFEPNAITIDKAESPSQSVEEVTLLLPSFLQGEHEGENKDSAPAATSSSQSMHAKMPAAPYPSKLHFVHVVPFLTVQQASACLVLAQDYASRTGRWDRPDFGRHAVYATCDFCVDDCRPLRQFLDDLNFDRRLFQLMGDRYGIPSDDLEFLDLFCANYRAESESSEKGDDITATSTKTMDRLEPHRDGSLLSFTVLLSPPAEFSGGGTFFDALRDEPEDLDGCLHAGGVVRPKREGCAVLHTGKALHGADAVEAGSRVVLVGFVNVAERWQKRGALAAACRDWGRMDVARWRYDQQVARAAAGDGAIGRGWTRTNRSDFRSCFPHFETVRKRADPEFQRLYKLQAEDHLLRTVLLDEPVDITDEDFWLEDADVLLDNFREGWQA